MTLLGLKPPRLADLHLCLYSRPIHPELFQIYAAEQYRGPAYEMTAWIVGCSHVLTFSSGESVLTELTTEEAEPRAVAGRLGSRLVQRWRFRGERTCRQVVDGRISYLANFEVETVSDNVYRQTYRDLVAEGFRRGMFIQFDPWKARGLVPFAYLHAEICARELRVSAFHGLPEDRAVVKTQSIFEVM